MSDMPRIGEEGFIGTTAKAAKIEETLSVIAGTDTAPEKKLTEEEVYAEGLKDAGLTVDKARTIMEAMFVNGYYEEEVYLGANTYVTLRSRQYFDTIRSNRKLETDRVEFLSSINNVVNSYNTAASLVKYGSRDFRVPRPMDDVDQVTIEESFTKRLDFLEKLPTQITIKLMQKVFEFDKRLMAVFSDGAPKDF
jgi:hypothetical protein